MAFNGSLIKILRINGEEYVNIPMKYIGVESYKITPNQRMETKASRDSTGVLHRKTVDHTAVKIVFSTPYITNTDVNALNTQIAGGYADTSAQKERKLTIQYYDPETDTYKTATCYIPDIDYEIYNVDTVNNIIKYKPIEYTFIEY